MTEYRIEIDPRATEDIETATEWLSKEAPHKLFEWLDALEETLSSLKTLPDRCPPAPENGRWENEVELQQLLFDAFPSKYRIIFTIVEEAETVRVLQIRHGSMRYLFEGE